MTVATRLVSYRRAGGGRGWSGPDGEEALCCVPRCAGTSEKPILWKVHNRHGREQVERSTARLILRGLLAEGVARELRAWLVERDRDVRAHVVDEDTGELDDAGTELDGWCSDLRDKLRELGVTP